MENNDYNSVRCAIRQVGLRLLYLTKQQRTTKKIILNGLWLSLVTIMFSLNPLLSKPSQIDLVLSTDIELSKAELIQIKNKIIQENIVDTPCWIYVGDRMYLIEKPKVDENGSPGKKLKVNRIKETTKGTSI